MFGYNCNNNNTSHDKVRALFAGTIIVGHAFDHISLICWTSIVPGGCTNLCSMAIVQGDKVHRHTTQNSTGCGSSTKLLAEHHLEK